MSPPKPRCSQELESRPAAGPAAPADAGPPGVTLEEVAKHNKKDRWEAENGLLRKPFKTAR